MILPMKTSATPIRSINHSTLSDFILCADDYSQNEAISDGILELIDKKRINATSSLVNSPLWSNAHHALLPYKTETQLGLHLNFTWGTPLSTAWKKQYGTQFGNLGSVIKQCFLTRYSKQVLIAEITAQVDAFTHAMGMFPNFIDGHQHIHQLPGIRDVLIELYQTQQWTNFFRTTSNGLSDYLSLNTFPKSQLIALLGASVFKKSLNKNNIQTNTSFAGIYNFENAANYRDYFKKFLKSTQTGGLIMCHPGKQSDDTSDPLYQFRPLEWAYFMSEEFLDDLSQRKNILHRS